MLSDLSFSSLSSSTTVSPIFRRVTPLQRLTFVLVLTSHHRRHLRDRGIRLLPTILPEEWSRAQEDRFDASKSVVFGKSLSFASLSSTSPLTFLSCYFSTSRRVSRVSPLFERTEKRKDSSRRTSFGWTWRRVNEKAHTS